MKAVLAILAAIAISTDHAPRASAQPVPVFLYQWGSFGSAPGQFKYPYGGAVGPDGSVVVTDQYNFRVQVFGPSGEFLRSWGSQGSQPGQFGIQIGVSTDAQGRIYVADYGNQRVQVFSSTGAFLRQFATGGVSTVDVSPGPDGNFYVVGPPTRGPSSGARVYVYSPTGQLLFQFGTFETARTLAFAPDGTLWVGDGGGTTNRRLVQFDPITGAQLQSRFMYELDPTFDSIGGMCILDSGVLCVCDFDGGHVLMLSPSLDVIGSFGTLGSLPGQLASAVDIAPTSDGGFFVVDLKGSQVVRFGPAATPARTASWGAVKVTYR